MLPAGPYEHKQFEAEILKFWLDNDYYRPEYNPITDSVNSTEEMKKDSRKPWCLICPPPNAYGRPHIGNISGYAYMDAMARYQRMNGKKVLVLPGKDHAGLEGEGVFVREVLEKQKRNKFDMKREDFYQEMMEYNFKNMEIGLQDEKNIGLSADFSRNTFTLDPDIVDTVLETFVQMYEKKMIYKGVRIVNWDPKARSVIADNQCVREEREGSLYYIRYPFADSMDTLKNRKISLPNWIEVLVDGRTFDHSNTQIIILDLLSENVSFAHRYGTKGSLPQRVKDAAKKEFENSFGNSKLELEDFPDAHINASLVATCTSGAETESFYIHEFDIEENGTLGIQFLTEFDRFISERQDDFTINYLNDEILDIYKNYKSALTVATTRPETMFGDTAVAVNPKDKRFTQFVGKKVRIPLTDPASSAGEIPVITSFRVLEDFGTGALKITPAHSQDDNQIMMEWNKGNPDKAITYQNVIDKRLTLVGLTPAKYKGRKYKEAKEEILNDLKDQGLLEKEEKVKQNVLISDRTKALVEPLMSSQWYLRYDSIKEESKKMVNDGRINLFPESMVDKFNFWMDNLRDWAISRSLWWGYRLPVWYAGEVKEEIDENGEVVELIRLSSKSLADVEIGEAIEGDEVEMQRIGADGWHDNFVDEEVGFTVEKMKNEFGIDQTNPEKIAEHKARIADKNFKYLVARNNGNLIGWALIENLNTDEPKWFDIYVDRNWRGKGVGSALLNKMAEELHEIEFELAVPQKSPGINFYKKNGFAEYSRNSENIYGIPIVQMKVKASSVGNWTALEYNNPEHIRVQIDQPQSSQPTAQWRQDEDVLDTWFSSGQWVYATLKKYDLMDTFFPTDVMVSGFDILENWISRMIMFTYFHEGKEPFKNVYLTGLVQGTDGQKMSKSKGNMIDMDKIVEEYGTDAVRLAYFYQNSAGASYSITPEKLKNFKGFLNKIWNASKYSLSHVDFMYKDRSLKLEALKLEFSKKVFTHIHDVQAHITENIEKYQLGLATFNLYQEFWHTYCDVLIEESKEYLWDKKDKETGEIISSPNAEDRAEVATVMIYALKTYLKLLHPFIPFITQTIWNEVPKDQSDHKVLMYTDWKL